MSDLTPYLCVSDARTAVEWYVDVLGAERRGDPIVMPDNRIGHAELTLGSSLVMLAEVFPEYGVAPPDPDRGNPVSLHLAVGDVDAVVQRARAAGAVIDREPEDTEHGRIAVLHDPFGHRWMLNTE
jgi:PhnB protein